MDHAEETVYIEPFSRERGAPVWFIDRVRQSLPDFEEGTDTAFLPIGFYFTPLADDHFSA